MHVTAPNFLMRPFWGCWMIALLFLNLNLSTETLAQNQLWVQLLAGAGNNVVVLMRFTPDGGYIVGGYSDGGISRDKSQPSWGETDYWIVKLDANRKKVWDQTLGGAGKEVLTALEMTSDGGYLLGGYSDSGVSGTKSQPARGSTDYWVVKLDASGTVIWDKTLGGRANEELTSLQQTADGGYLLGGSSTSGKNGDKSVPNRGNWNSEGFYLNDYWLIKLDAQGTKEWDKVYGGEGEDKLLSVQQKADKGLILGGISDSNVSGDKTQASKGKTDYWVIKLDSLGNKSWDRTIGGSREDWLVSARPTRDGGYILGGTSVSDISGDKSEPLTGDYDWFNTGGEWFDTGDIWLVKLDSTGKKVWDGSYGGREKDWLASVHETQDGGYILASQYGEWDVVKIDGTGRKEWGKVLASYVELRFIEQTSDGSYLAGGGSYEHRAFYLTQLAQNQAQSITFKPIPTREFNPNAFPLYATASSGLPVTFQIKSGPGAIYGSMAAVSDTGMVSIIALQEGNATYAPAEAIQTFRVLEATLPTWNLRYGGMGADHFADAVRTSDGGYLAAGYTSSDQSGDVSQATRGKNDFWIVKADKNGKKLWDQRYGGPEEEYLNRVIQTRDGGYLLAGSVIMSANKRNYLIIKTDAAGKYQWRQTYGGSGYDELKKVIQLSSGEYVLGGTSDSPVSGHKSQPSQGGTDYWLVKVSATGNKIWDKRFGGSLPETLGSFTETKDGGFILGGSSLSNKTGDKSQSSRGGSDFWLVKTNHYGQLLWEKTFGSTGDDALYSIGRSNRGSVIVAGTSDSPLRGEKSQPSRGGKDYWLIKVDEKGNKIWDRTFGGTKDDELRASTITDQGHYILAGSSYSDWGRDKTEFGQGESDYWIVEVDELGQKVQDQRFGGSGKEELRTVFETKDGGLFLGGRSDSEMSGDKAQPSQGGTDYWLVKVAPLRSRLAARTTIIQKDSLDLVPIIQVQTYPNPFQEQLKISFTIPKTEAITVRVLDSQGKAVTTLFQEEAKANQTYQLEWRPSKQINSMYLLQVQTPTEQITQKIILKK